MALRADTKKLLRKALNILNGANNEWVETKYISGKLGVTPAKIRSVLEWNINNVDDCYIEGCKFGRLVKWRSNQVTKLNDTVRAQHPDDPLIDGLADMLGRKEKYRQALISIRQVIDNALGDVISH